MINNVPKNFPNLAFKQPSAEKKQSWPKLKLWHLDTLINEKHSRENLNIQNKTHKTIHFLHCVLRIEKSDHSKSPNMVTLSGWWLQPLWKIWKSIGMIIPNIWKVIKLMFQTTNQLWLESPLHLFRLFRPASRQAVSNFPSSRSLGWDFWD